MNTKPATQEQKDVVLDIIRSELKTVWPPETGWDERARTKITEKFGACEFQAVGAAVIICLPADQDGLRPELAVQF